MKRASVHHAFNKLHEQAGCGPDSRNHGEFVREVRDLPLSMHKLAMMAVSAATSGPIHNLTRAVLDLPYKLHGMHIIGEGYFSTAIELPEGNIVKVNRSSAWMGEEERQRLVCILNEQQAILLKHLGGYAIEQAFSVEPHPALPALRVVTARQAKVEGFEPLDFDHIPASSSRITQLRDFCTQAQSMAQTEAYVPDLAGNANIGFDTEGKLVMVDTVPMPLDVSCQTSPGARSLERLGELQSRVAILLNS